LILGFVHPELIFDLLMKQVLLLNPVVYARHGRELIG
jgi:hypothetical protein